MILKFIKDTKSHLHIILIFQIEEKQAAAAQGNIVVENDGEGGFVMAESVRVRPEVDPGQLYYYTQAQGQQMLPIHYQQASYPVADHQYYQGSPYRAPTGGTPMHYPQPSYTTPPQSYQGSPYKAPGEETQAFHPAAHNCTVPTGQIKLNNEAPPPYCSLKN